jgi:hypothetical protein
MMSKKEQKRMKNKIKTAVMQALEADAKSAGASGDDSKEDGKKKLSHRGWQVGCGPTDTKLRGKIGLGEIFPVVFSFPLEFPISAPATPLAAPETPQYHPQPPPAPTSRARGAVRVN